MKIIVDNKIPFIKEAVQKIAEEVVFVPGKDFTPDLVKECRCTDYTYPHTLRPGLARRKQGEVHSNSHHRLRPHRYGILPASRHRMDQCSRMQRCLRRPIYTIGLACMETSPSERTQHADHRHCRCGKCGKQSS